MEHDLSLKQKTVTFERFREAKAHDWHWSKISAWRM